MGRRNTSGNAFTGASIAESRSRTLIQAESHPSQGPMDVHVGKAGLTERCNRINRLEGVASTG